MGSTSLSLMMYLAAFHFLSSAISSPVSKAVNCFDLPLIPLQSEKGTKINASLLCCQ